MLVEHHTIQRHRPLQPPFRPNDRLRESLCSAGCQLLSQCQYPGDTYDGNFVMPLLLRSCFIVPAIDDLSRIVVSRRGEQHSVDGHSLRLIRLSIRLGQL